MQKYDGSNMIGQKELLSRIDNLIAENKLPKFTILVGPRGCGKKTIIAHIHKQFGQGVIMNMGISVSDVRQAVEQTQTVGGTTMFCTFADADNMSLAAKNALLKIVEEPPKNVYFIMTLESLSNTLETIKSRGTVFTIPPYTPTEIGEYASQYRLNEAEMHVVADICETPGEVDMLRDSGIIAFDEYVKSVVDHITDVSGANCFNIAKKIKFKDTDEGFDLRLFLKAFMTECGYRMSENITKYANAIKITTSRLQELNVTGIAKQNVFDMWILDIRKEWFD